MIVGLISDTHIPESRDVLWPQVYEAFSKVDCILHAGDIYDIGVIEKPVSYTHLTLPTSDLV